MTTSDFPLTGRFLQSRLRHAMSDREMGIVEGLIVETDQVVGEKMVLQRGQLYDYSTMLIDGYMLRTIHDDGERHVVGIHVPGDFVDLHAYVLKRLDHDIVVIGNAKLGYVPHKKLEEMQDAEPHLTRLLWFSTMLDAAIHREWIMKSSQLRAMGRIAHLLCELWYRLRMVGLGKKTGFRTPLTQVHLAQMCGISPIHVNRSLRDLREAGILEFRRGRITIHDEEGLKRISRFNPAYLYGEGGLEVRHELNENKQEANRRAPETA